MRFLSRSKKRKERGHFFSVFPAGISFSEGERTSSQTGKFELQVKYLATAFYWMLIKEEAT
jgi:hypothetical protein